MHSSLQKEYDLFITNIGKMSQARNISKLQKLYKTLNFSQIKLGFQNLNISNEFASDILEFIIRQGGYGLVIPLKYRYPKLNISQAKEIAIIELEKEIQQFYPDTKFDPIQMFDDEPFWWRFCVYSQELINKGITPGGMCIYIDKSNGNLWNLGDRVRVHKEEFYLDISSNIEIDELKKSLKNKFEYFDSTDYLDHDIECLRNDCLLLRLKKSSHPQVTEKIHGFFPNLSIFIKKIPYGKGFQNYMQMILDLVYYVINNGGRNLVLTSDRGDLIKILEYKSGKLFLNSLADDWSHYNHLLPNQNYEEKEMSIVKLPFSR